ncbi:hypothetical protein PYW08_012135 [Mythimna loreyi]|uniref:Uncharacterized protein n=1 Tax=Mythimna loreyi TaxID=667449 RepID=A0ACC2PZF1_9NEOP|nr:hypothetical protein PYW08_012135 [Mythimna loreyi]
MLEITFKLTLVFLIVSPSFSAQNVRKYNMEEESYKLYKQDFRSVLKRFRRTTDYMKILQDKLEDLKTLAHEMSLQVLHYFHSRMEKRVIEVLPAQAGGEIKINDDKDKNINLRSNRNTPPPHISEDDWKKINELDNYNFFYSELTIAERNTLKDMGFSFAGQVIHAIINHLKTKPETKEDKFTKLPYGDDIINKFTTIHPDNHEVTYWQYIADDGSNKNQEPQPLDEKKKEAAEAAQAKEAETAKEEEPAQFRASEKPALNLNETLLNVTQTTVSLNQTVAPNANQTTAKTKSTPTNSSKSTAKTTTSKTTVNRWVRPKYSGFSAPPTASSKKVVTSIVTFGI